MGKIAFVFSGQGAQFAGMGKPFYDEIDAVKELFDSAESIREGTIKQCFEGTAEELKLTQNTQPCLYLASIAGAIALEQNGISADGVAGFSLGEIASLAYSGAYSYLDGFRIVSKRGELMGKAAGEADTSMAAVLKLDKAAVCEAVKEYDSLYAVNFNCPGQTVVSGLKASVDAFSLKVKEMGGRAMPLAVSAAFHSPFMKDAAQAFERELSAYTFSDTKIPAYSNFTAKPYEGNIPSMLASQMQSPVRWQEIVENMLADGYTDFIELGAGKTLCGLISKTSNEARVYAVSDMETLMQTIEKIKAVREDA